MKGTTKYKLTLFILVFSVVLFRWWHIPITDSGFARSWFYGDAFSDRNVMSTVQFYTDSGFDSKYAFLPVLFYKDTAQPKLIYTHYPGLPDLTATVVGIGFGTTSARKIMLLPLLLSTVLFFLIFYVLEVLTKQQKLALIGGTFLVCSNYFFGWADDLHQHVYVELVRWMFVLFAYRFFTSPKFDARYFCALFALYFTAIWLSFEPVVFMAIVAVGFSVIYQRKFLSWPLVVLLCSPMLGFSLHLFQNYCYFGSWDAVIADMTKAAVHRTNGAVSYNEIGHTLSLSDIPFAIQLFLLRVGKFYWLNGILLLLLLFFVLRQLKKENIQLAATIGVLLVAALSWHFVMPQHALVHMFTLRHYAIPFALLFASGASSYYTYALQLFYEKKWIWIAPQVLLLLVFVAYATYEQIYLAMLTYGFFYPHWGSDLKFLFWI